MSSHVFPCLPCAFQLHGTLQIDISQAMRRQGLGQLKCLVPLQEVAVHVQSRLRGTALKEVASGLADADGTTKSLKKKLGKRWRELLIQVFLTWLRDSELTDFMGIRLHEYLRKWLGMAGVKPILKNKTSLLRKWLRMVGRAKLAPLRIVGEMCRNWLQKSCQIGGLIIVYWWFYPLTVLATQLPGFEQLEKALSP